MVKDIKYLCVIVFVSFLLVVIGGWIHNHNNENSEQGRIRIQNYKPDLGSRIVEVNGPFKGYWEVYFSNGDKAEIPQSDDVVFNLLPNEVVLRAVNGSYQLREDYLDCEAIKADKLEGEQQ